MIDNNALAEESPVPEIDRENEYPSKITFYNSLDLELDLVDANILQLKDEFELKTIITIFVDHIAKFSSEQEFLEGNTLSQYPSNKSE